MSYEKSPIDNFFYNIYGYYPPKAGQSYELIVAAAMQILNQKSKVTYDKQVEGIYSKQFYQIDGIINDKVSIEAKDYSLRDDKVGRPDVQKQGGGLPDLPFDRGIFASATGYTRNAEKYAEGTKINPNLKEIDLYDIKPSTESDEEGRIKTIVFNFHIAYPDFKNAKIEPVLTEKSIEDFLKKHPDGNLCLSTECIFNEDKTPFITATEWSANKKIGLDDGSQSIKGTDSFDRKFIQDVDDFYEISGIRYEIPIVRYDKEFRIDADGKACLLVKNMDGSTNKLLTDVELKNVNFNNHIVELNV